MPATAEKPVVLKPPGTSGSIKIRGKLYGYYIEQPGCAHSLVSLLKADAPKFTGVGFEHKKITCVVLANRHQECTCEDFLYRKSKVGLPCKHITAALENGLLEAIPQTPEYVPDAAEQNSEEAWASARDRQDAIDQEWQDNLDFRGMALGEW